ncbi:MAG: YbaK/EbsC family protein [Candidatus Competibacteraceae bacterium]|nr:YbaK/EbsC family protein [Candidatus Competibacteraceae bacterium]
MNLPDCVRNYLDDQQVPYRLIPIPSGETLMQIAERLDIPARQVVRIVLLRDAAGIVMIVLPCNYILDFSILCRLLQRELAPLHGAETARFFQNHGCKAGSYPPLPAAFGLSALVDNSLVAMTGDEEIYFDGGSSDVLVAMRGSDFRRLLVHARWEHLAVPMDYLDSMMRHRTPTPTIWPVSPTVTPRPTAREY